MAVRCLVCILGVAGKGGECKGKVFAGGLLVSCASRGLFVQILSREDTIERTSCAPALVGSLGLDSRVNIMV